MLAYVFWHWNRPDVDREAYEAAQRRFHESLAQAPSPGLVGSWSAALTGALWLPQARDAYEDWYLLSGSEALDPLNEAAITASRQQAHDAAAALAEGGTAGLYRLRAGHVQNHPTHATWFARPAGLTYAALFNELGHALEDVPHDVWMRQMVLGPTPEFCLRAHVPVALPWPVACHVALTPVWP